MTGFKTFGLLTCLLLLALVCHHESHADTASGTFQAGDPQDALALATDKAVENNQRLLVIMGANWCHDSRALTGRINRSPLKEVIDEHYQVVLVDVGNLEIGKEVVTSLGIPVYYATPTVLIIDPVSGDIINNEDRHQWGSAETISMDDSVQYFERMTTAPAPEDKTDANPELTRLMTQIDAFEQVQADRLYRAYERLSPMLAAFNEGDLKKFSERQWNMVRKYRNQVPEDLARLRQEARKRASDGETDIELTFPEYPAFFWEKNNR